MFASPSVPSSLPSLPSDCLRLVYHHLPLRYFARCLATCRGWNLHDEASDPLWLAVAHAHATRQGRHPDEWLQLHPGWSHFRCADAAGDELRLRSATAGARLRPRAVPPPDGLRRRARQADERCRRRSVEKDKRRALEFDNADVAVREWRVVSPTWEAIQGSGGRSRSDPWVRAAADGGAEGGGGAREARGLGGAGRARGGSGGNGGNGGSGAGEVEGPQDGNGPSSSGRKLRRYWEEFPFRSVESTRDQKLRVDFEGASSGHGGGHTHGRPYITVPGEGTTWVRDVLALLRRARVEWLSDSDGAAEGGGAASIGDRGGRRGGASGASGEEDSEDDTASPHLAANPSVLLVCRLLSHLLSAKIVPCCLAVVRRQVSLRRAAKMYTERLPSECLTILAAMGTLCLSVCLSVLDGDSDGGGCSSGGGSSGGGGSSSDCADASLYLLRMWVDEMTRADALSTLKPLIHSESLGGLGWLEQAQAVRSTYSRSESNGREKRRRGREKRAGESETKERRKEQHPVF